jgi:hypothetical protein
VSICPGPNMAYYSKIMTLKNITDHIYGRDNMITRTDRPHMFIKELSLYMEYLKNKLESFKKDVNKKDEKYLLTFSSNLNEGILYYKHLFQKANAFNGMKEMVFNELDKNTKALHAINSEIQNVAVLN